MLCVIWPCPADKMCHQLVLSDWYIGKVSNRVVTCPTKQQTRRTQRIQILCRTLMIQSGVMRTTVDWARSFLQRRIRWELFYINFALSTAFCLQNLSLMWKLKCGYMGIGRQTVTKIYVILAWMIVAGPKMLTYRNYMLNRIIVICCHS